VEIKDLTRENLEATASGGVVTEVAIGDLDKAELLAALVNYSWSRGRGVLRDDKKCITVEEAQKLIDEDREHDGWSGRHLYFDYVKGRPIKCDLSKEVLDTRLYDRDNGQGAGAEVVARLRAAKLV
jgi:hypothetical protein